MSTRRIDVTHSTLKVKTWVFVDKIFYLYTSATNGCVHIVSDSGLICPVTESEEQLLALIDHAMNNDKEVKLNGTTKETT